MLFNVEQLAAANKAPLDFAMAYYGAFLNGAERIVALNIELSRSVILDSVTGARAMFDTQDPEKAAQIQATTARALARKLATYSQSVFEITAHTQEDMVQAVRNQTDNYQKATAEFLDMLVKAAPANSERAVAAIREFIAAANAAAPRKSANTGRHLAKAA